MEFFLGIVTTILCMLVLNIKINKINIQRIGVPIFTQSRKFLLTSFLSTDFYEQHRITQSSKVESKKRRKGFVLENVAYWIEKGFLVSADLNHGQIDFNNVKRVDTHTIDSVELKKIMFIVEKLTEGNDDSSNTGY